MIWCCKAVDKTPHVGRLYHHLAILAHSSLAEQLFYYCKSLGVSQPYLSSRKSILIAFDPIRAGVFGNRGHPVETTFVYLHSTTFSLVEFERFDVALDDP